MPSPSELTDQQLLALANSRRASSTPHSPDLSHVPDHQLLALFANSNPNMSPAEDIGRSAVTGLERGVTGLLGTPKALSQGADWLNNQGLNAVEYLTGQHLTPQQRQAAINAGHIVQGASPFGLVNPNGPSTEGMNRRVNQADIATGGGGFHAPQTMGGRFAETVGEMAPGAILPGSTAARVARVAVPAVASQTASELAPDGYKPAAKIAGGIIGGGLEGFGEGIAAAPSQILARSASGLTQDQIAAAVALRSHAASLGLDLTIPEAAQQVTNGATGMGRLQRILESTNRTQPDLSAYFAQRPDQVRGAVTGFADGLAPGGTGSPSMLGLDANRAAMGAQMDANSQRAALSRPYYTEADQAQVDPGGIGEIIDRLNSQIAGDKTGLISPRLQALRSSLTDQGGAPILDQGNLSTARNYWQDQIDLPPTGQAPLTKYEGGIISSHLKDLDALLKANPSRQAGDAVYASASRNIVDPLNAGPVGRIAATDALPEQTAALYPQNPPVGQSGDTSAALSALDSQREGLAAALTHQHIMTGFNQATRDLTSGPSQYGGAAFARALMGNNEQAATLRAGLDTIDPSGFQSSNLDGLVEALMATGKRERPGSMTAFNESDLNALKAAPAAVRFLGGAGDPLEWTKNLSNATGKALFGRNMDLLSQMIRDPDTAAILGQAQNAPSGPSWLNAFLPAATQNPGAQP